MRIKNKTRYLNANDIKVEYRASENPPIIEYLRSKGQLIKSINVSPTSSSLYQSGKHQESYVASGDGSEVFRNSLNQSKTFSFMNESCDLDDECEMLSQPLNKLMKPLEYLELAYNRYLAREVYHKVVWFDHPTTKEIYESPYKLVRYMGECKDVSPIRPLTTVCTYVDFPTVFVLIVSGNELYLCSEDEPNIEQAQENARKVSEFEGKLGGFKLKVFHFRSFKNYYSLLLLFDKILEELSEDRNLEEIIRFVRRESFFSTRAGNNNTSYTTYYKERMDGKEKSLELYEYFRSGLPISLYTRLAHSPMKSPGDGRPTPTATVNNPSSRTHT